MSRHIVLVFSWLSLFVLTACPTFMTRNEVDEMENRKQTQDQVVATQKGRPTPVAAAPATDLNNRFSEVDSDLRELNGRVEVLENQLGQASNDKEKIKKQNDELQADHNKKVQILQEEVAKLEEMVNQLTAEVASLKSTPEKNNNNGGKKDLFQQAEEQFEQKNWKKAALTYQKFKEANPKSKKVPESIYKMGVCFQELGMKEEAKTFYEELMANYSAAPEAKKARTRLKSLKK